MARYRVRLTAGAERDLDLICRHIEQERGADASESWLETLIEKIASLEQFPNRGSIPPELSALGIEQYRQTPLAPYRIVYQTVLTTVFIMIIAHGKRDFQSLLQDRLLVS